MPAGECGRVGTAAEAIVGGRGQREGEVLAQEERLSIQPGPAAVPACDGGRIEETLPEPLERLRQLDGANAAAAFTRAVAFQAADDAQGKVDRSLDLRAVRGLGKEEVRPQHAADQGAEVVVAATKLDGQRLEQLRRRRDRLADEEREELPADEERRRLLLQADADDVVGAEAA